MKHGTRNSITGSGATEEDIHRNLETQHVIDSYGKVGWKAILLLQFQTQFQVIILLGIYITSVFVVLDFTFAYSCQISLIEQEYTAIGMSYIYCYDMVYLIDLLLMISYKSTEWPEVRHLHHSRHTVMVILDVVSVIPIDAVYSSLTTPNMRVLYTLRLRYILRVLRFWGKLSRLTRTFEKDFNLMRLLQLFVVFNFSVMTSACAHLYLKCADKVEICEYIDLKRLAKSLVIMTGRISSTDYFIELPNNFYYFMLYCSLRLIFSLYVYSFSLGLFLTAFVEHGLAQQTYFNVKNIAKREIFNYGIKDRLLINTQKLGFDLNWNTRTMFIKRNEIRIPRIMMNGILLDVCWDAFKHSHIFRDQDTSFLRYVASFMKQSCGIPGEPIFERNSYKSAMVYVVSGVIQILSVQDGETPILSLSGGTCIGETTLLVSYRSKCSVVCQSYCNLNILYKKDLMEIQKRYPKVVGRMMKGVKDRYKEAHIHSELMMYSYSQLAKERGILTLKWLKTILHDLHNIGHKDDTEEDLNMENMRFKSLFSELAFYPKYLDLLVISEQMELINDSVFLKEKCPCILQPNSFIITIWNNLIALTALALAYVYPYYASFQPNTSPWFLAFLQFVSFVWCLDVYVTVSTAVKIHDKIIVEVFQIAKERFKGASFSADVIAAVPLELFVELIIVDISYQGLVLLHVLKLLKLYKISNLFVSNRILALHRITLQYSIYFTLFILYCCSLYYITICYDFVCDTNNVALKYVEFLSAHRTIETFITFFFLATLEITSVGLVLPVSGTLFSFNITVVVTIINQCSAIFLIYLLAKMSASATFRCLEKYRMQEYAANLKATLCTLKVSPQLHNAIFKYIRSQIQHDGGVSIVYTREMLDKYHNQKLKVEVRYSAFDKILRMQPLFQSLPDEFIAAIATCFEVIGFGPGTVITYSGEVCKQMYITLEGYCKVHASDCGATVVGANTCLSVLELCFGMPVVSTVVTMTHVRLLTVKKADYIHTVESFPNILSELNRAIFEVRESHSHLYDSILNQTIVDITDEVKERTGHSFKHFGYRLQRETKQGADYHDYFDKLQYFSFLRYVSLRLTICPYGYFIFYWEAFRCIFAFITLSLCPVTFTTTCTNCIWYYIFLFLDCTAWLDICVRHHIGYFNKNGIEITHPLKAVVHYWSHAFLIDLLGCFPFESLTPLVSSNNHSFMKYFRVLQFYRIYYGIKYLDQYIISPSRIWTVMKFIPIVTIVINFIGSTVVNMSCTYDPSIKASENFTEGVMCKPTSWIGNTRYRAPLDELRVHLYGVLFVASIMIRPSVASVIYQNITEIVMATIMTLLGCGFYVYIAANIISTNLFRNTDLSVYQEAMQNLIKFLSYRSIDKRVKREVIHHFEYVWHLYKGKHLHKMVAKLHNSLQEDILFDVYAKSLQESKIFQNAHCSFFRCLLLIVEHEVVIKRGIICRVNDIESKIYIIFKGQVEVLGPDYNRLLILSIGSMFGNLDDCPMKRQTLTMVAKGHVELLTLESVKFYNILSNYRKLKSHFRQLIALHADYLESASGLKLPEKAPHRISISSTDTTESLNMQLTNTKWFRLQPFLRLWNTVVVTMIGCVSPALELYVMTMADHSLGMVLMLYTMDTLNVISIFTKFRTGYEDDFGILVMDQKKIAQRYMKQPLGFFLDLVTVFPTELMCLFFLSSKRMWIIWSYCRCNRLLRIILLVEYFQIMCNKLHVNILMMRTCLLISWFLLVIHMLTCMQITICCMNPQYNVNPLVTCNWPTSSDKFVAYLKQFSVVAYILTLSSPELYFPNSVPLILYTLFLLVLCRLLYIVFFSEMCAVVDIILNKKVLYTRASEFLKAFMIKESASPAIIDRFSLYSRLLWIRRGGEQFPPLLDEAPYYLREAVLNSMFGFHLRRHPKLQLCHVDLIRQIAARLESRIYLPGDYITFIGDINNCMYFIHEGSVDVLYEDDVYAESVCETLNSGNMFGFEQGLYKNCGHEFTYRANIYSFLLILNREQWFYLLDFFPASFSVIYNEKRASELCSRTKRTKT